MTVLDITSEHQARGRTGADHAPAIVGTSVRLPKHRYAQKDLAEFAKVALPPEMTREGLIERFLESVGVTERYFALPAERYAGLRGLGDRNEVWLEVATELGEQAVRDVLDEAGLDAGEVGMMMTTTVTGIAVPSLDARLMNRIEFDPSLVRMPLFGLGCLGGAAGLARCADWLRAYPDRCAILLSVELCSLTFQPDDASVANLISSCLFGDGAAAVLMAGADHPLATQSGFGATARVLASESAFFADTERVMGWDVVDTGFKIVLDTSVPEVVREHVPRILDGFLAQNDLVRGDVGAWVIHPGGPKIIDAMEDSIGLARGGLAATRESLAAVGNLSSSSVLYLLDQHRHNRAPGQGPYGVLMAMGPAFCAEIVLLRFEGGFSQ